MDCENCRHLTVVGLHDTGAGVMGPQTPVLWPLMLWPISWALSQRLPAAASVFVVSGGVGASWARWGVVAFKRGRSSGGPEDDLLDKQRRHKPPERQFTCHLLFLPPDTSPGSQSQQPPRQSPRTIEENSTGSLISSFLVMTG